MKKLIHHKTIVETKTTKVVAKLIPKAMSNLFEAPVKGHKPRNFTKIKLSINIFDKKNRK